jgi:NAD(P)-dependent dehydrogenase (short-subunit alcohol dehydrogenase family)
MPFNGLYNVSKTALECYAQALRQELNLIGQKVVTVLPGAVETPLSASSVPATERLAAETRLYTRHAQSFAALVEKFKGKPIPPEKMAKTVLRAATAKHPRLSYSKHRNVGLVLLSLLPRRMQCAIIKLILNKNARRAGKKEK